MNSPSDSAVGLRPLRASVLAGIACALLLGGCASVGGLVGDLGPVTGERLPAAALARYEAALTELEAGRVDRAEAGFTELAADFPQYTGPQRQLALLTMQRGDLSGARARLHEARSLCVQCAPLLTDLGLVERQLGDFAAARDAYREAVAREPDHAPAHFNLAVLYELYLNRPRDAMNHYGRYLELEPTDAQAGSIRAWIAQLERQMDSTASTAGLGDLP